MAVLADIARSLVAVAVGSCVAVATVAAAAVVAAAAGSKVVAPEAEVGRGHWAVVAAAGGRASDRDSNLDLADPVDRVGPPRNIAGRLEFLCPPPGIRSRRQYNALLWECPPVRCTSRSLESPVN